MLNLLNILKLLVVSDFDLFQICILKICWCCVSLKLSVALKSKCFQFLVLVLMRDGVFFVCSAGFLLDILMQIVELTSCTFLGKNSAFALCIQFLLKITLLVGDCLVNLSMLTSLLHERERKNNCCFKHHLWVPVSHGKGKVSNKVYRWLRSSVKTTLPYDIPKDEHDYGFRLSVDHPEN